MHTCCNGVWTTIRHRILCDITSKKLRSMESTPGPLTYYSNSLKMVRAPVYESILWARRRRCSGLRRRHLKDSDRCPELRMLVQIHEWLDRQSGGSVDALLFGTVGGVTVV